MLFVQWTCAATQYGQNSLSVRNFLKGTCSEGVGETAEMHRLAGEQIRRVSDDNSRIIFVSSP